MPRLSLPTELILSVSPINNLVSPINLSIGDTGGLVSPILPECVPCVPYKITVGRVSEENSRTHNECDIYEKFSLVYRGGYVITGDTGDTGDTTDVEVSRIDILPGTQGRDRAGNGAGNGDTHPDPPTLPAQMWRFGLPWGVAWRYRREMQALGYGAALGYDHEEGGHFVAAVGARRSVPRPSEPAGEMTFVDIMGEVDMATRAQAAKEAVRA